MSEEKKSYKQIIKSTGIYGGSQVVTILIGIIRNKIIALLLGVVGVGLISMYQSVLDILKSLSSFGIETTGVKEIASASLGDEDFDHLSESVSVIDKLILLFSFIGAIGCLLLSYPISLWFFADTSYIWQICWLSIAIFFTILSSGQMIVLHGLRKISYMVKSTMLSSFLGLILSLPLYYFFKTDGIVPALIWMSLIMYIVSSYYRRKVKIKTIKIDYLAAIKRGIPALRVGFFIVISGVITAAGYFLIKTFLNQELGLYTVGLFQAAWSITNVYLMLVLKSMGADFYPRLCSIINKNEEVKNLVNQQTYVVLIVSVPLIIMLFICSKLILSLLYSSSFTGAVNVLNWQILGTYFKIISWPLGFILLAKSKGALYFFSEMLFLAVYISFTYLLYRFLAFDAVGVAYLISYVVYLLTVYVIGVRICKFKWSGQNLLIGFINLILVLLAFYITQFCREYINIVAIPIFVISFLFSVIKLNNIISFKSVFQFFRKNK